MKYFFIYTLLLLIFSFRADALNEVNVYSYRQPILIDSFFEEFTKSTGIKVNVLHAKKGLLERLLSEGANTPADLVLTVDIARLNQFVKNDLLMPIESSILKTNIPSHLRDSKNRWFALSKRARIIAISNTRIKPGEINRIEDLVDPKWKGKLGWAPSNGSFQAMLTGMRLTWGEDKTKEWLQGIMSNEPIVYPKNTPQVQAAADKEIQIGMVNHYYLHRFIADKGENFPARNHYLNNGDIGSVILVSGVGILDASDNKSSAEKFIKFMTSKVAQQYFASQVYEYPLVTDGVKPNRMLRDLESLNKPEIDISQLGDLEATQSLLIEVGALE